MQITTVLKIIPPSNEVPYFTLTITRSDGATLNLSLTPSAYTELFVLITDYEKSQEGG